MPMIIFTGCELQHPLKFTLFPKRVPATEFMAVISR